MVRCHELIKSLEILVWSLDDLCGLKNHISLENKHCENMKVTASSIEGRYLISFELWTSLS